MATTGVSTVAARSAGPLSPVSRTDSRSSTACQLNEWLLPHEVDQRDVGRKRLPDDVRLRAVTLGAQQDGGGAVVRRECGGPFRRPLLDEPSRARIDTCAGGGEPRRCQEEQRRSKEFKGMLVDKDRTKGQ